MNKKFLLIIFLFPCLLSNAQTKKFDTTVKMGDVGYKINCSNKKADKNIISITPIGFKNYSNALGFTIIGQLKKAIIDDFNNDGYPDVVFYSFDDKNIAQIYALASVTNTSCIPISMPDVYIDAKLRVGYQGHDELSSMGGFLIRKFPVYGVTDSITKTDTIIGQRIIEYKAKSNASSPDNPTFKFEVFASRDIKK